MCLPNHFFGFRLSRIHRIPKPASETSFLLGTRAVTIKHCQ